MKELNNIFTSVKNSNNVGLFQDKEERLDILMNQVFRHETQKITIYDKKPTRAMITQENCSINKINQPKSEYIPNHTRFKKGIISSTNVWIFTKL